MNKLIPLIKLKNIAIAFGIAIFFMIDRGLKTFAHNLEPDTYFPGDAARIEAYVVAAAAPGSIILMHPLCGQACSADRAALPGIIKGLKVRGYSFVTVSQLLALRDK